jgi:hypothetical protein
MFYKLLRVTRNRSRLSGMDIQEEAALAQIESVRINRKMLKAMYASLLVGVLCAIFAAWAVFRPPDAPSDGGGGMRGWIWIPAIILGTSALVLTITLIVAARKLRVNKRLTADLGKLEDSLWASRIQVGKVQGQLYKATSDLDSKTHECSEVKEFLTKCKSERDEGWTKFTNSIHKTQSFNAETAALKLESNKRVLIAQTLGKCVKMIEEHAATVRQLGQPLVDKGYCEAWLNSVEYSIDNLLGPDAIRTFYQGTDIGETPADTVDAQARWIGRYVARLNLIISEQLYPTEPLIPEDEAMLQKAEDSARAWAEKQQRNKAK